MSGSGEDRETVLVSGRSGSSSMSSHEPSPTITTANGPSGSSTDAVATGIKFRDTCRVCAASKIRCSKEKPSCARCDARGIPCHYVKAKRPGRVPGGNMKRSNPEQGNDREKSSASAQKGSRRAGETFQPASRTESMRPARTTMSMQAGANQAGISVNTDLTPALFSFLSSPVPALDSTSDGALYPADSMFGAFSNAADSSFFAAASGLDGDEHLQSDLDVFMNESVDSTLEADLAAIDRWLLFDTRDSDGGANGSTKVHLPTASTSLAASHGLAGVGNTDYNSLSSSSSGVNLAELMDGVVPPAPVPSRDLLQSNTMRQGYLGTDVTASSAASLCDCMAKALDLLKRLSKGSTQDVPSSPRGSIVARLLTENETDVETCLAISACPSCHHDRFLLMVCFMIAMKILARYASAAALCGVQSTSNASSNNTTELSTSRNQKRQGNSISDHVKILVQMSRALYGDRASLPIGDGKSDEKLSTREATQQVLRELHRVQILTSQLSLRLKSLNPSDSSSDPPTRLCGGLEAQGRSTDHNCRAGVLRTTSNGGSSCSTNTSMTPLSGRTFDWVEQDVRKSLSTLSAVVRGVLKNS